MEGTMKKDLGLFIIRFGLGILFLLAGFGKITGILGPGIAMFSGMVGNSIVVAWLVALGEFFGGVSLVTGVWTKYATIWLSIIILGAIIMVSLPGFKAADPMTLIKLLEDLVVFTSLIGINLTGSGKCSVCMTKE